MRSSLVGLQLLLACAPVLGSPVKEERKECCRPGVPRCPEGNPTLEDLEKSEGQVEFPEQMELNLGELEDYEDFEDFEDYEDFEDFEELEERSYWKRWALDYFNQRSPGAFYRPREDTSVKGKSAISTMLTFMLFLVDTNCAKEEGLRSPYDIHPYSSMESLEPVPCVALPKHEQTKLKCAFDIFMNGRAGATSVVDHFCEPLVTWEESGEMPDLDDLIHSQVLRHHHY